MNKKKVIIGVLMATMFVMVSFVPAVNNMNNNITNDKSNANNNLSNKIALSFHKWYINNEIKEKLPVMTKNNSKCLFMEYINQSKTGKLYISELTDMEKSSFNKENKMDIKSIESIINSNKVNSNKINKIKNKNSVLYIMPDDLPGGVTSNSGSWVMVTINNFVYHAPWWLGGWTWEYGQHDVLNNLYIGNMAQKEFNGVYDNTGNISGLVKLIGLGLDALGVLTAGLTTLIGQLVYLAGFILSQIADAYLKMYESTYANEPSDNKYLWSYLSIYQYDKNNPIGLASSVGWYGKLSNGNTVTAIPNLPGSFPVAYYFSEQANNVANKIGTNNWVS